MKEEYYISQIVEPQKKSFTSKEFNLTEGYFEELKSELALRIKLDGNNEFKIPSGYLESTRAIGKGSVVQKVMLAISSIAAVLLIGFLIFTPKEAECISFDCLLEQTELSYEDIEYLEEYESDLLSFEEE